MPGCSLPIPRPRTFTKAAALAGALALGAAQAASPLQTEDADALDAGHCELELSALRLSQPAHARELGSGVQCGLGARVQAGLAVAEAHEDGVKSRSGQMGGKWRLSEGDQGLQWALAGSLGMDQEGDGGWRHARTRVSLVASLPAGPGTLHANLGRYRDIPSSLLVTTWGLAYEHGGIAVAGLQWAPMVELFGAKAMGSTLNLGLRGTLVEERLFLNLALGRETRAPNTRLASIGLRWAF